MSSSITGSAAQARLAATVKSTQALCDQLASTLLRIHNDPTLTPDHASSHSDDKESKDKKIDPIALSRDAATLVRAHSTKLSLLIINEPFTPSAIVDILNQLLAGPILGITTAVQACDPTQYTACFRKELAWRSSRVLLNLNELLAKIPADGKVLSADKRTGSATDGKGSLPATGILWSSCDEVLALVNKGISGFLVSKAGEWKDTLKDVMEELKEWGDEEDDDDDEEDDTAHEDDNNQETSTANATTSAQDLIDDFMNSSQAIPRDDPDGIRPRLESTLRRLRLVILLYQAIIKRRLKQLPPLPPPPPPPQPSSPSKRFFPDRTSTIPERLDEVADLLRALPERFGDLTTCFYDMDPTAIDEAADGCFLAAFTVGELLSLSWTGGQDEFSDWMEKFRAEIRKS